MKKLLLSSLLLSATLASAHDNWTNASGDVWKNSSGQCWRNGAWTPATAHPDCDGALKAQPRVQVTIPAPVAAPSAPVPKVEVAKPVNVKVTYSTDAFFDFDKSVIKPEGKAKLDDLVTKLKGITLEVIIVVGHTDWIGTDSYNMNLGARRANAVKAYLVSKGIEKNRVYVESKGEKQPIADNKTVAGRAKNRRVEIEVVGTRPQ